MLFQTPHEAGSRLADMIAEADRDMRGFEIVAFGRDSLLLARPIAERFGLPMQAAVVKEIALGLGQYMTVTSFGNGRVHNGHGCEDGSFGCHSASDFAEYIRATEQCVDETTVAEDLREETLDLNGGRPVYAPERVLIVISEEGDGHDLIAAIEALRLRGSREVLVALPVCEPWMASQIDVECISVMGVPDWGLMPEHFASIYAAMPINALSLTVETIAAFRQPASMSPAFA